MPHSGPMNFDTAVCMEIKLTGEGGVEEEPKQIIRCSVADPDPGSGAFLTPGSGIGFSRIPNPYF